MIYLQQFMLPSMDEELHYLKDPSGADRLPGFIDVERDGMHMRKYNTNAGRTCFESQYPFLLLSEKGMRDVTFSDVTFFCGNNGSGKSTLLNIIAQKLELARKAPYNRTTFFDDYLLMCQEHLNDDYETDFILKRDGKIITSDDVFDYNLSLREKNNLIDEQRKRLFEKKKTVKIPKMVDFTDKDSIENYKIAYSLATSSYSKSSKQFVGTNPHEKSNGEVGFEYFINNISAGGLYLLDEPENSLSSELQIELKNYIEAMARCYNCQFIIATHSPFLLSIKGSKIYDMDRWPVQLTVWEQINDVKVFLDFFENEKRLRNI